MPLDKRFENQKRYQNEISQRKSYSSFWYCFNALNIFTSLSILLPDNSKGASRDIEGLGKDRASSSYGKYSLLLFTGIGVLLFAALMGVQQIFLLYTSYVFKWSLIEQGYVIVFIGFLRAVVLLLIYPTIVRLFKKRSKKEDNINNNDDDRDVVRNSSPTVLDEFNDKELMKEMLFEIWMIRIGLAIDTVSYLFRGLAASSEMFVTAYAFGCLGAISSPSIRSLLTGLVPPSQVGQLLGAVGVLESIVSIMSPAIFSSMYSLLVRTSPHLIWYLITCLTTMGVALAFVVKPKNRQRE
ncbi:15687_t:CDS:2 [Acaulospora colombiana]|uniref:15687_t:CDS:1 n=1 Tax=Acaulospora colombiana TaxID=27376 RepID=A0ACA9KRP7_9GLOM|nr:15687_t:CDS:2 [Acaulospora colombiana]